MVQHLILLADRPMASTVVVELTLLTCAKATIIACYLPQPVEEHTRVYEALARLPTSFPRHLLILGEDLQ